MNPRISSIENLIARDPAGRNVFGLMMPDQLRLAAQSLRLARRVAIVGGFYIPAAKAGETDGPHGAKVLGDALTRIGLRVDYITDAANAPIFEALGISALVEPENYLESAKPTHLVSIERVGRSRDGRYRDMRGTDITDTVAPLDELFLEATDRGLTTIGIGDGGNEIGMGRVFADTLTQVDKGPLIASVVSTDYCIAAGVSNWGAYGLAGALSVLVGQDLLPDAATLPRDLKRMVRAGGAVDGVTLRREPTVDGIPVEDSVRMLENIRRQISPSPLEGGVRLTIGILGYGQTGRAATQLVKQKGHLARISDEGSITLEQPMVADGVETGGHSLDFLRDCDLVVASPGVRPDAPIRSALHGCGIPVISELEMAYQLCDAPVIAVTGTVGKRTTLELAQRLFAACGKPIVIGGNRGIPLSAMVAGNRADQPLAVAVSSFQLETVVRFRPRIAVILNISEAHLDRHATLAEYARIKSRIFMNQHADDALILNFDDERVRRLSRKARGQTFFVSGIQAVDRGAWLEGEELCVNIKGSVERFEVARPEFAENLLSAVLTIRLQGVGTNALQRALHEAANPDDSSQRSRRALRVNE